MGRNITYKIDYSEEKGVWEAHDKGLYQVNGRHNAYGDDALLYLGKTTGSFCVAGF